MICTGTTGTGSGSEGQLLMSAGLPLPTFLAISGAGAVVLGHTLLVRILS